MRTPANRQRKSRRFAIAAVTTASAVAFGVFAVPAEARRGDSVRACNQSSYTQGYNGQEQNSYGHFGQSSSNFNWCP